MFLVDSHCHLDLIGGDTDQVIAEAKKCGVHTILNVCVSIKDFPKVLQAAESYLSVYASVGLHPNDQEEEITEAELIALAAHEKVIAIGETGLDYYRTTGEIAWQHQRFRAHIEAAKQLKKPLIIHTRQAKDDTIRIMQEEQAASIGGVMHCFSEDWDTAKKALDLNFHISFSGVVTFKNALDIQETAKQVPLDRILIETDAPYLAPVPHRGKPNVPAYVLHTATYLAALRGLSLEAFAEQTTQNFFELFKGALRPHV